MEDTIEVFDQSGRRMQMPRSEFAKQMMAFARANWDQLDVLRPIILQFLQTGFAQEGLEIAQRTCELSNEHVNDIYWRAAAKADAGMLDQAAEEFGMLQEDAAYPADQARAAVGLARVKARQGDQDEAGRLLEWAIETDPKNPGPMIAMWSFWNEQGKGETGLAALNQLAHRFAENAAPHRALAHAAYREERKDDMLAHAGDAIQRSSGDEREEVLAEMSWLLGQANLAEEIIKLLGPMANEIQHPHALLNLSKAYVDAGRKDEARELLKSMQERLPAELHPIIMAKLKELEQA